jgi:hypothetical protein
MTREEIIEYAKKNYPSGTIFKDYLDSDKLRVHRGELYIDADYIMAGAGTGGSLSAISVGEHKDIDPGGIIYKFDTGRWVEKVETKSILEQFKTMEL